MIDPVLAPIAWGAGAGVIAGVAYATWGARGATRRFDLAAFAGLGVFCIALFLFQKYIGDPYARRIQTMGFTGGLLLVGAGVAWLTWPFLSRRKRRRSPPEDRS